MSADIHDSAPGDLAPGDEHHGHSGVGEGIRGYVIGLVLATVLTIASFYFAQSRDVWGPSIPVALLVLAVAQMGVHLAFFLHITTGPDNTNNVMALAFGVLIVLLVIVGSIWIMAHLNQNMTPGGMMMTTDIKSMAIPTQR
ncbi:cytochrome o ubiquinol oxidase subunit IV [Sphingomonas morindae]|uniref:Cytochrome bo(3) ubiquinol oxidase subunit 4 n=1 Tax=Sphingomonas morindae TaxID=1541170 RepID=A0ABY4XAZ2_9SPHN|nr:cytochrome o ubiquinol oxidase subunit IV [Sphingomonas morindae]USI74055.1 cytochrome o ubiquinol oxidase subunit IV [Sphingomonas morindae]